MCILKKGHQWGVYVPLRALFLVEKSVTLGRSVCQNLHSFLVVFQPNSCMVTELLT